MSASNSIDKIKTASENFYEFLSADSRVAEYNPNVEVLIDTLGSDSELLEDNLTVLLTCLDNLMIKILLKIQEGSPNSNQSFSRSFQNQKK